MYPVEEVQIVERMSLEDKVGQIMMAHFHGSAANEDSRILIQEIKVGGIIYYTWANELSSPDQVRNLSSGLQAQAGGIPLLIAVDQEGKRVARLRKGFTALPDNGDLGKTGDPSLAEKYAYIAGCELLAAGVNTNFAPVVDVNNNPQNPIIGVRSYGDDPELVALFGKKALEGYARAGILAIIKHFPGHGDVTVDSHIDLPVVNKSLAQLEAMEILPFRHLAPHAEAVMTAHLLVPAFDADLPSTLSEKTISYLRNVIGFQGAVIADSLVMGALAHYGTIDEVAVQALNAGCDLLLFGGRCLQGQGQQELAVSDLQRIHKAIVSAVKAGLVAEKRLNSAVKHVLKLKQAHWRRCVSDFASYSSPFPTDLRKAP